MSPRRLLSVAFRLLLSAFCLLPSCVPSARNWVEPAMALTRLHPYHSQRASGSAPIPPGGSITLADIEASGIVTHLYLSFEASEAHAPRLLVLRIWWDGAETPCVESPVGDFFLCGGGELRNVHASPISAASDGRALNCFLPMPFYHRARIAVANEGSAPVTTLAWSIDWQKHRRMQPDMPLFHAQYRQEVAGSGNDFLLLDARGKGHYLGCHLTVDRRPAAETPREWKGGGERIWIDGEDRPRIEGDRTARYFLQADDPREGNLAAYGVPVMRDSLLSLYRFHLLDPIPFDRSFRFAFRTPKGIEDLYAAVAYWYQTEPHVRFTDLPSAKGRVPAK